MAASAKFISFLLLTSLLAMQIHGRESQYFSKYTSNTDNEQKVPENEVTPTTVDPVSTKEQQYQPEQQEQQEPVFLPENQNTGYGLYGHETGSGKLPSTTTPTNLPYNSESEEYNNYPNTQNNNNNNYYYNRDSFNGGNQNEFGSSKLSQTGSGKLPSTTTPTNLPYNSESEEYNNYPNTQNNNNNYYYNRDSFNGGNQNEFGSSKFSQTGYNNQKTHSNAGNNNYYSQQRQGMSDTRFLENGKYFYDVNSENYNTNSNQYENTKNEVPSNLNYNGGYYGQNNQNSYEYRNSMGGYQNNQEEFQNEENEFEEP